MIHSLNRKDKISFIDFCINYYDFYQENFITINKERKFLNNYSVAEKVFDNIIKKGDKAFILEEKSNIKAAIIIVGYSDRFPRKYIKILTGEKDYIYDLLKFLNWNYHCELFLKINKEKIKKYSLSYYDRVKKELKYKFGWDFFASRGNELLLIKHKSEENHGKYSNKNERHPGRQL